MNKDTTEMTLLMTLFFFGHSGINRPQKGEEIKKGNSRDEDGGPSVKVAAGRPRVRSAAVGGRTRRRPNAIGQRKNNHVHLFYSLLLFVFFRNPTSSPTTLGSSSVAL